ncbi:MAG: hypothetical protein ACK5V3_04950 [Bdellovibrionales bacterium]
MKTVLMIAVLMSGVLVNAEECKEKAGQLFLGKARNVQVHILDQNIPDYCTYQIEFIHYQTAFYCGLGAGEIGHMSLRDETCSIKEGMTLSGILVLKDDQLILE